MEAGVAKPAAAAEAPEEPTRAVIVKQPTSDSGMDNFIILAVPVSMEAGVAKPAAAAEAPAQPMCATMLKQPTMDAGMDTSTSFGKA